MSTRTVAGVVALSLSLMAAVAFAQRNAANAPTLTTQDRLDIQELGARYAYALDTGADNGYMYADVFTPDGAFGERVGREKLAEVARGGRLATMGYQHIVSNFMVQASPEGATGIQYIQVLKVGDATGKPTLVDHGGRYEDTYVRTPQGWRIKTRKYVRTFPAAAPAAPAR